MKIILGIALALLIIVPAGFADPICLKCLPEPEIDVVFVIDSTGSMADEIRSVKTHIEKIVNEVRSGQPSPKLRIGVVSYRDHEPEEHGYLVRSIGLDNNIDNVLSFIEKISAQGGGDLPEAVEDGLYVAIHKMSWDDYSQNQIPANQYRRRMIFLIGDAAPHGVGSTDNSFVQGCPDGHNYKELVRDAQEKDISIFTISGSGIDSIGKSVYREIAIKTGGSYTHLNYERRDVEEYYAEEGVDMRWAEEAKEDSDYDARSNSILVNSFGSTAKESIKRGAKEIGVSYDGVDELAFMEYEERFRGWADWLRSVFLGWFGGKMVVNSSL